MSTGVVPGSIRQTVKSKILGIIKDVAADYKIVQLDPFTLRVIDAASSMPEIMDSGVYLLEIVTKGRQPYPQMASIYFVSPTEEIVDQIIKDFTPPAQRLVSRRKGPAYGEAHIFFTDAVPPALFEKLAGQSAASYIRSFVETYINFVPIESRAYHLGAEPAGFGRIFREKPVGLGENPATRDLQRMAAQIVGAYVTMNELPSLRYQKSSVQGHALKLASLVQESFDSYCRTNPNFKPLRDGQLLILDRTVDLLAPLLHEFTLQAMANDVLQVVDGSKFSYGYGSGDARGTREATLDENDSMWISLRHKHIAQVSQVIIEKFNEFISENKAAQGGKGGAKDLKDLKEMMNAMTEFQEMKGIFSLHLTLAQQCLEQSDKRKLIDVAKVEQILATGMDAEGEPAGNVWSDLVPLLDKPNLTTTDKARVVLIYFLTQPSLSDADRANLLSHAHLGNDELASVRQLAILSQAVPGSCAQRKPALQGKRGGRKTLLDEEMPYEVSRYVPATKIILDDVANNELDEQEFPFLKGPAASAAPKLAAAVAPVSLRARSGAPGSAVSRDSTGTKGSIGAFVVGGVTYSETRSAYELSARSGRDFFVGGDRVLTPELFLQLLRDSN